MSYTRLERMQRTAMLLPSDQMRKLQNAHVMLFGVGGVGSFVAEALIRAGVGHLTIVDHDTVAISNANRQLPAMQSTVGLPKTEVIARRLQDIAPDAIITVIDAFYLPTEPVTIPDDCDFVADAIDTISAKIHLVQTCHQRNLPIISCMGMGNRLNPTLIRIGNLFETNYCPLCKVMRKELRARSIPSLTCIYSTEPAIKPLSDDPRPAPGSISYVPSVAGLYMAYHIVDTLRLS